MQLPAILTLNGQPAPNERKMSPRAEEIFNEQLAQIHRSTDYTFAWLLLGQWAFAVILAIVVSPLAWEGLNRAIHLHVWIALILGGVITLPAALLGFFASGKDYTRQAIALAQMLIGALLIHLTGGRIETHFHVFGSLAFLAFYRDWRVLFSATLVVVADHTLRGFFYPESVFGGITNVYLRVMEHAAWVVFEDVFLLIGIARSLSEMRKIAIEQAQIEQDEQVQRKLNEEIKLSQTQLVQSEKMASLGQMVAGLAHEMNTPLGYVQNNLQSLRQIYRDMLDLTQRFRQTQETLLSGELDKLEQILVENAERLSKMNPKRLERAEDLFNDALDGLERMRELVKNLRDFSRLEEAEMKLANINDCIDSALKIAHHQIKNSMLVVRDYANLPETLCYPAKLNQVFLNLINNAAYACEKRYQGTQKGVLKIQTAQIGDKIVVKVSDNGTGIAKEHLSKIFDPFFTTKKVGEGTGLGLSISYKIIEEHKGKISVESKEGEGTTFTIEIPVREQIAKKSLFIDAEAANV